MNKILLLILFLLFPFQTKAFVQGAFGGHYSPSPEMSIYIPNSDEFYLNTEIKGNSNYLKASEKIAFAVLENSSLNFKFDYYDIYESNEKGFQDFKLSLDSNIIDTSNFVFGVTSSFSTNLDDEIIPDYNGYEVGFKFGIDSGLTFGFKYEYIDFKNSNGRSNNTTELELIHLNNEYFSTFAFLKYMTYDKYNMNESLKFKYQLNYHITDNKNIISLIYETDFINESSKNLFGVKNILIF